MTTTISGSSDQDQATQLPASPKRRLSGPMKVGIGAAAVAIVLVVIGIFRGNVPLTPTSILLALVISAGSWGLVAWAIATAAVDVDSDVAAAEAEPVADVNA